KNLHHHSGGTQAQRTNQPYESRPDRTFLYPVRNEREAWQSDFVGVVRLSTTGERYWVHLWTADQYRLRLSAKNGLIKTCACLLAPIGSGRHPGQLLVCDEFSPRQFLLRVCLRETDQRWLEVHFEVISQRRISK